jgi:hypothetical protein
MCMTFWFMQINLEVIRLFKGRHTFELAGLMFKSGPVRDYQ